LKNPNVNILLCVVIFFFFVASSVLYVALPPEEESTVIEPTGFESKEILLYYGNGGSQPGSKGSGKVDFYDLQARYDSQGCPTTYTDQWPNDLNDYRVIFLIEPGDEDDSGSNYFTIMQVNQAWEFLKNGGRLVVQGDHSGLFGINTVNDLLANLGVGIQQNPDDVLPFIAPAATDITADQLTDGVSALDMDGSGVSSLALSGTAKSLVRDSVGNDVVAVDQVSGSPPRPGADVLVYGDTQVLDDFQLQDGDGDGPFDNFVFADNIAMCQDQPPIADAGGPYTGSEGSTIVFDGSGSTDDFAITEYKWTFNGQTVYGVNASFTFNDNWEGQVTLTVTDSGGNTDTDTTLVQILNVPPTVKNGLEEKKVKVIPVPWQIWRLEVNGVTDIIFFDPPQITDSVAIVRDYVVLDYEIPLNNLTWVETENLNWIPIDDPKKPYILELNGQVEYFIPTTEDDRAVLVRYSVAWASTPSVIESHFINEAILESRSPQVIVGSLSNFDVHNDFNETINNFELELYGNIQFGHHLYGHDNANHNIIQIDRSTGQATVVGPTGFNSGASGMATSAGVVSGPGGTSYPAGTYFGLFRDQTLGQDFVVVVDLTTGTATKVVQTNRTIGGRGIEFGPDGVTLYVTEGNSRTLSTINTATGVVNLVGDTGRTGIDSLHLDPSSGFFYSISGQTLVRINPANAATAGVSPGGLGPGFSACTLTRSPDGIWYSVNTGTKTLVTINIITGTVSGVVGNLGPQASGSVCGTVFEHSDILYVYDPPGPPVLVPGWLGPTWYGGWGTPPLIKPLQGGVEIKWMDPGHPVQHCEWIHFGLRLSNRTGLNLTGAKAYLTQLVPVPTHLKEEKVKVIPVPWQKWRLEVNGVSDIIFFDPPAMPFDEVAIVRDFVVLDYEIPLDNLTWMGTEGLNWTPVDDSKNPYILALNEEVELFIPTTEDDRAVLVRYSVAWANTPSVIETHFVNEAVLESKSPQTIVGWLSNFDVHNDYNESINNFELEFYGNITPSDILSVYDPAGPPVLVPGWLGPTWYGGWGAPPSITSIPGGIEIKWVDTDHPVPYCEWIHFGVSINTSSNLTMTGVKAYLTQMKPVPVYTVDEGTPVTLIAYATDPGSDDLTFRWSWGDGTPDTVMTYYNNGASPDPYPSYWYGVSPFSATNAATHVYGDDGHYNVTLTVTDDDNGTTVSYKQVVVRNVDPTVTIDAAYADAEIGLRVAGRKWNNVSMDLYEDGTLVGSVSIERLPGSPNDQMAWIPITLDLTKTYNATVFYIPEDPPKIGGNPIWIYIKFPDGSVGEIHHTFNVQQSMIRDSDHWNHVEPWEVDINAGLIGHNITLVGTATDPGSDDLGFKWSFLATTTWYRNDGTVGTFPTDPYPSPWGTFPFSATDTVTHIYSGSETIILTVYDDDGGMGTATLSL
jgi:hypothetical protein